MIELIIKKDDREINRYFLPQGVTTLGRGEDNTIILDDSCVSRRHARIKVEGGRVSIEDLGSGNGTFHGEARIEREDLADGDEIVIEPFHLLLRKDANPQKVVDSTRPVPSANVSQRSERIDPPASRAARQPGGSAAGGPRLEVVRGEGGPFLLSGEEASIGRSDEAKITLQDPSSSRKHAAVAKEGRGWILKDLDSANGTYLNGAPVKNSALSDGDIILIGNTELRFVDPSAQEVPAQPVTPPPKTAPVSREAKKPSSRPPPRRPAPEPDNDGPMMEMGGHFDGGTGSMPPMDMPSSGGTEVGGAPPPAWSGNGALEATGEGEAANFDDGGVANLNGGDYGGNSEEFGMELGEDALFPGGERPPESLVGKFIYSFKTNRVTQLITVVAVLGFFLILVMKNGAGPVATGNRPSFVTNLDRKQQITLSTMEQDKRDAQALIDPSVERKDYQGAFQKYYQIITFGSAQEMQNVRAALVLKQEAIDAVYTMHEALVVQALAKATKIGMEKDAATKARFDRDFRDCKMQLDLGKKRGRGGAAVAAYTASIAACTDLLVIEPNNADGKTNLATAKQEKYKLVGEMSAASLEELKGRCQRQMDVAAAKFAQRSPLGYQQGIREYEKVLQIDAEAQTQFPAAARAQIASAKKKLTDNARPLRDQATQAQNKQDWLGARRAIRQAININPYDVALEQQADAIKTECLKNAARQLQEAKVYMNAENWAEAKKSVALALQYADEEGTKENRSAKELLKQIQRQTETAK